LISISQYYLLLAVSDINKQQQTANKQPKAIVVLKDATRENSRSNRTKSSFKKKKDVCQERVSQGRHG